MVREIVGIGEGKGPYIAVTDGIGLNSRLLETHEEHHVRRHRLTTSYTEMLTDFA